MPKMHANEITVDEPRVRSLLRRQCPAWAELPITPVNSYGTDHALFRLGDKYVVRLPRIEWETGSAAAKIDKEFRWLPLLSTALSVPISAPVFKGVADANYPFPWLIATWLPGAPPAAENNDEYHSLAIDLAEFLNQFHRLTLPGGPSSRRGISLRDKRLDADTRQAIQQLANEIDTSRVTALWDELSATPTWEQAPVWVHGDFLPGNVLVENNRLTAVLDFTDVGMGDPACDLIIAWALFNPTSRQIFKSRLQHLDDATWERSRGWALSIALIMLPYYQSSNPYLTQLARRVLSAVCEY